MYFYDELQQNQVNKAIEEGNKYITELSDTLDVDIFRAFRTIVKNNSLSEKQINIIINAANENVDITKLTQKMIEDNLQLALNIIKECDNATIEAYYSDEMSRHKREYIFNNRSLKNLLDYKKYGLDELEIILRKDFESYKQAIIDNNFDTDQLNYIAAAIENSIIYEEMLNSDYTISKMELISIFIQKGLDLSKIDKYSDKEIYSYLDLNDEDYDISKIYKKKYPEYILDFILNYTQKGKDPDEHIKIIQKLDYVARDCYLNLCEGPFTENCLKSFLDSYKQLEENNTLIQVTRIVHNHNHSHWFRDDEKDISFLFNPAYNYDQLSALDYAFNSGINLSEYCDDKFSAEQMRFIFDLIKHEIDVSTILNPEYSIEDMRRISFYNNKGIFFDTLEEYYTNYTKDKNNDYKCFIQLSNQINKYRNDNTSFIVVNALVKYNKEHEYQVDIENALEAGVYYSFDQFFEDLGKDLDVNKIWKSCYNNPQREEIRKGLIAGIDVEQYANPTYTAEKMCEIREELESKLSLDDKIKNYTNDTKAQDKEEDLIR